MRILTLLALPMAILLSEAHATPVVYETDFTAFTGNGFWSGAGVLTTTGGNAVFWNSAAGRPATGSVLNLSALEPHDSLGLTFTFWTVDSWDGLTNTCCGTDYLEVLVDDQLVYRAAFRVWGVLPPRVDAQTVPGAAHLVFANGANLFGSPDWADAIWLITLTDLPHTSSGARIEFRANGTGWDGGLDESFALDNLTVVVEPVPEPHTWMLLGAGVVFLGFRFRGRTS